MPLLSALPFAGLLLSIALGPLLVREWWHIHYGKAALVWAALATAALAAVQGGGPALSAVAAALAHDYLPFILLLAALYAIAGGVVVQGRLRAGAGLNTALLAGGAVLANIVGTTGAAMLIVRPLLAANAGRRAGHVVVFLIFIVGNIGGALSPLGDPPLLIGFLHGVPFDWPLRHLWAPTVVVVAILLALFYGLDRCRFAHEPPAPAPSGTPLRLLGLGQIPLVVLVGVAVLAGDGMLRLAALAGVTALSLLVTPPHVRRRQGQDWGPLLEVAKLFAAIFVCAVPVLDGLAEGQHGPFAPLLALLVGADGRPQPIPQFILAGALAAVLDNAPTYLVFFQLAGGDAAHLAVNDPRLLTALSLGAVYAGALTYIGNAPNFMIYAIARRAGVAMPGFFAYSAWAGTILLPLFALVALLFLR